MVEKTIVTRYAEYGSMTELETCDRELCEAAIAALSGSYAPYSNFNVGAAVRLADGNIVIGSNQENAASPSGLCAERTAMFAANATHPGVPMRSIATWTRNKWNIDPEANDPVSGMDLKKTPRSYTMSLFVNF